MYNRSKGFLDEKVIIRYQVFDSTNLIVGYMFKEDEFRSRHLRIKV